MLVFKHNVTKKVKKLSPIYGTPNRLAFQLANGWELVKEPKKLEKVVEIQEIEQVDAIESIESLRSQYEAVYERPVARNKMNDRAWILKKIEEKL
jgi:hypothetical protein